MNYITNLVTKDASEFESFILLQEDGLADLSSRLLNISGHLGMIATLKRISHPSRNLLKKT